MVAVQAELPGEPGSVRAARRLVAAALREWGLEHLEDSGRLLVSELATNAVLHARTAFGVEVARVGEVVRVTVHDRSPRGPERRRHGLSAATGRGLGLLTALSSSWGTEPETGPWAKAVWFELPVDPALLPQPGESALQDLS